MMDVPGLRTRCEIMEFVRPLRCASLLGAALVVGGHGYVARSPAASPAAANRCHHDTGGRVCGRASLLYPYAINLRSTASLPVQTHRARVLAVLVKHVRCLPQGGCRGVARHRDTRERDSRRSRTGSAIMHHASYITHHTS